jgi:hypothetical protein
MANIPEEYGKLVTQFYQAHEAASVGGVSELKERLRISARALFEFERRHEVLPFREIVSKLRRAEAELECARQRLVRWKRSQEGFENWIGTRLGMEADLQSTAIDLLATERLLELGAQFLPMLEAAVEELKSTRAGLVRKHDGLIEMIPDPIARDRGDFSHVEKEVYARK